MRKQNKIVSLILVLALLLGVFVALPATKVVASAADFTPSAVEEEIAYNDEGVATPAIIDTTLSGNLYASQNGGSKLNSNADLKMYKVTESSGNTYLKFVPNKTGATSENAYFTTESLQYLNGAATLTEGYIVYDFDIATDSEIISSMIIYPIFEKDSGGNHYTNSIPLTDLVDLPDYYGEKTWNNEKWNHITLVFSMHDGNEFRVYRNSVRTKVAYPNFPDGETLTFKGIRFDIGGGASVSADQSVLLDNISCRVYEAATHAVWSSGWTNTDWDEDVSQQRSPSYLPAVATVDGTTIYKEDALQEALSSGATSKSVEILRDVKTAITVNTPAVIETHGLNVTLTPAGGFTSATEGTVVTITNPSAEDFTPSVTEQGLAYNEEYVATPAIIDTTVDGNLYASQNGGSKLNNADNLRMYKVTETATGNTYLKLVPTVTGTTSGNSYFSTESLQYLTGTPTALTTGFIVYDFDIATDSEVIGAMKIQPVFDKGDGSSYYTSTRTLTEIVGNKDYHGNYTWDNESWNHITLVMNLSSNEYRIYRASERVAVGYLNDAVGAGYTFKGVRFDLDGGASVSADQSVLLDNISCRVYDAADNGVWVESGYISGWAGDINKMREPANIPAFASVDGATVHSVAALQEALSSGGTVSKTVEILREFKADITVNTPATIKTHGFGVTLNATGAYVLVDNGNGNYTVKLDAGEGTVKVALGGEVLIEAVLPYGTDIIEYLKANNTYLENAKVIASDSGKVYKNATWDVTPTTVSAKEMVFNLTATEATEDVLFFTPAGAVSNPGSVENALSAYYDVDIVFNADYELTSTGFNLRNNKNIYLAGHTLSFPAGATSDHHFVVSGDAGHVTFIGGRIEDKVHTDTYSIFYFYNNPTDGEVKLVNTEVFTVSRIAGIRNGGTITLENSSINMLEHYRGSAFEIDEGSAENKCVVNLINSTVRYNHSLTGNARSFVNINGTTVAHELNISGCDISMDFTSALITATNPAAKITIDNTQLNVMNLLSSDTTTPVVFGENVVSAVSLTDVGTFGDGVVEVKSGVPGLPYAYTAEYATVNWSNGEQEKWAAGTYPVNPFCQTDGITKVEAGQTYTFEAKDVELGLKANVTLNTNLVFNLYIPTTCEINSVVIGGVEYSVANAPIVSANYVECYHFEYELAPYRAAAHFSMVVTLAGGTTVGRDISFVEYAELVLEAYASDTKATNLVKAILNYIAVAQESMGVYNDGYEATRDFEDPAATEVTGAVNNVGALSSYITSSALDLSAAPKWVFKLAEGVTGEDITFSVGGTEYAAVVVGNTLVLELPAYDMLDTITITAGEAEGEYNFAAYYAELKTLADGFTTDWNNRAAGNNAGAEATFYLNLLDAFHTYAQAAAAYKG